MFTEPSINETHNSPSESENGIDVFDADISPRQSAGAMTTFESGQNLQPES